MTGVAYTKSCTSRMGKPYSWSKYRLIQFSTPAVTVTGLSGLSDSTGLDPVFVATFDQRVDPASIVELIEFESGDVNGVRLATAAEIARNVHAHPTLSEAFKEAALGAFGKAVHA